jgi:CO/xanthine dehydrogenase FAD-binding subunit
MKPAPFTYHRASSAAEAVEMLAAAGDDASVLAGGQSLVPLMNFRVAQPAHLVDINHVDELDYIRTDDGALAVGARTRQARSSARWTATSSAASPRASGRRYSRSTSTARTATCSGRATWTT